MADKKKYLVFMGSQPQYRMFLKDGGLREHQALWASSVDSVRGYDLSEAQLVHSGEHVRDEARIRGAMKERGMAL